MSKFCCIALSYDETFSFTVLCVRLEWTTYVAKTNQDNTDVGVDVAAQVDQHKATSGSVLGYT